MHDDLQFANPWWFPVSRVDFFVGLPVDWTMHWQVLPLVSIKPSLFINGIHLYICISIVTVLFSLHQRCVIKSKMLLTFFPSSLHAFITFYTLQSEYVLILINSSFFININQFQFLFININQFQVFFNQYYFPFFFIIFFINSWTSLVFFLLLKFVIIDNHCKHKISVNEEMIDTRK